VALGLRCYAAPPEEPMRGLTFTKSIGVTLLCAVFLMPRIARANSPAQQIQETIQQVMTIVNSSAKDSERIKQQELRDSLMPRFDWPDMAKQALGKHWDALPARQDEFISAFAEFLSKAYIGKIGSYKDEKIIFVDEVVKNSLAEVKTKIVPAKGDVTSVNYQLRQVEGEWKIYDVVVEDISLVVNYRSQFNRILSKGSFDDLLRQLKQKDMAQKN
jgi:phospholipid transport system substrate-binding protein